MKRLFLLLIGASMLCASYAQVVEEGEAALVYYSPKTTISIDFEYTVETYEPGLYAQYAEAMLGVKDVVTENKTIYRLKDVQIRTATTTDFERPHKVTAEPGIPLLLTINEKGLLTGYNLPPFSPKDRDRRDRSSFSNTTCKISTTEVAPFPEEVLQAATPLAQANEVAKQIMHLRETRMYLLNGEVEHAPADGQAMQLVLEELDKQEQALTALFTGKKSFRAEHKKVQIEPIAKNMFKGVRTKEELYFFSEENGFTDGDNVDADTIKVTIYANPMTYLPVDDADQKGKKKAPAVSQIVYNLPGKCEVEVNYNGQNKAKRTVEIAQYGVDVPLGKDVFTGKELPVIVVSERTGNIVSISK